LRRHARGQTGVRPGSDPSQLGLAHRAVRENPLKTVAALKSEQGQTRVERWSDPGLTPIEGHVVDGRTGAPLEKVLEVIIPSGGS
jgi:hypothetical protein